MTAEIWLDHQGDLPAPPGFQIVESEVDFLRFALDDSPLLLRGEKLCTWAEAFYTLRGRPCQRQESVSAALQQVFTALTNRQAKQLARKIEQQTISPERITPAFILLRCFPSDSTFWQSPPSLKHAAQWLLWLYSHQPDDGECVILREFARWLARDAGEAPEARAYMALDKNKAAQLLFDWLGLGDHTNTAWGEFPLPVDGELLTEIKTRWMKRIIETQGHYFEQMLAFSLPLSLRMELAECAAQFYAQNNRHLNRSVLWDLQPYLSFESLTALERILPPPQPTAVPQQEAEVLTWFRREYLPYRRWQASNGGEQATELIRRHARAFARWYLEHYPTWLIQPGWISYQQSARLQPGDGNTLTLCVILDGLPAWDAEELIGQISALIERLELQQDTYIFSPLPTVTEFAKGALLTGVPPRLAPETPSLGIILPDDGSPLHGLQDAQPGDLIFWRVSQPDKSYHFEKDTKRERQVRAEIQSILHALKEVVDKLPSTLSLRIIITSDHGRLLSPASPRRLSVPPGMQAHGRVAWGELRKDFDESGFAIDESSALITVHGERFGLKENLLIALNEDSFQGAKAGKEPYPHGGLFPEEAIVPWFVFERDAQMPKLVISVHGSGEAETTNSLTVKITNLDPMRLECLGITLSHLPQVQQRGEWFIKPLDDTEFTLSITPWPKKSDLPVTATLLIRQPNGKTFLLEEPAEIEVTSLYERDDSLLKDLEL